MNVEGLFAQEDDILEFLVTHEGLAQLRRPLDAARVVKVVIAGGGSVGTSIALDLVDRHHDVTLMEQNVADRREAAGRMLPGVTVMAADACEFASLAAADVRSADVMIAATGDDEDNLVISWLSKQEFGVPRVISRINNARNEWLFNESWGVDVSVSTPALITSLVDEAVEVGAIIQLMTLAHGRMRLLEVTLDATSPAVVEDLDARRVAPARLVRVVAVVRNEQPLVPSVDHALPRARPRGPDGARRRDRGVHRRLRRLAARATRRAST